MLWNLDTTPMSTTIGKCGEFCSGGHMSHGKKQTRTRVELGRTSNAQQWLQLAGSRHLIRSSPFGMTEEGW